MINKQKVKSKSLLSLLLALAMVLGMIPAMSMTASAAEMTYIKHVDIQMDAPKAGMSTAEYAATIGVDNKHELSYNNLVVDKLYCYRIDDNSFDLVGTNVPSFEEGGVYACYVDIIMNDDEGYQFEHDYSEMTVLVNGQTLDNYDYDRENGYAAGFEHDSYTLTYTLYFTATGSGIEGTTGTGTESDPVIVDTFAEFKAAMESTEVTYVKLNGISFEGGKMPSQASLAAAISNTTYKVLTIEGTNMFWSPMNGNNDSLIWPRADLRINGTGTLEYQHGNTGGTGAVINMTSAAASLTINGNVTLKGNANGTCFGRAIFAQAGTTTINGGTFIGYDQNTRNTFAAIDAVCISGSANVTINGGEFSASLHPDMDPAVKAYSLSITSTATGAISIKQGTFPQGIDIDATGKTITTCGYFDTAKASITAGGNPVEATASTDVLKSTEVIVTNTGAIGSVTVAVTAPVAGAIPAAPSSGTANVTVSNYMWTIQPGNKGVTSFEGGKTYRCAVVLNPASGYTFKSSTAVTIGGQTATIDSQSATAITAYVDFTTPAVPVSSVAISVAAPTAGAAQAAPTTGTANVSIDSYQWKTSGGTVLDPSATFEPGKTYRLEMTIYPTSGQTLSNTATATVNGNAATIMDQTASYLNCYYEFTLPEAIRIDTIAATITPPKAGATPDMDIGLPAGVICTQITWEDVLKEKFMSPTDTYIEGRNYRCDITIKAKPEYIFANPISKVTLNGNDADAFGQTDRYVGFEATFVATAPIEIPVESVTVEPSEITLAPGASMTPTAVINPTNHTETGTIVWSKVSGSDNITIDHATGKVSVSDSAADGDTAMFRATFGDKSADFTVTVAVPTEPTDPAVKNGAVVIDGKTVLYKDGAAVTGTKVVTVDGKTYAVVKGYVVTGKTQIVNIGSKTYIVDKNGIVIKSAKNKLVKVSNSKWYIINKYGIVIKAKKGNKLVNVGKKTYIVNKKGLVQKSAKNKLVKVGKKSYIVDKKGVVLKNKKAVKVGKKTYKVNKKGIATRKK